MNYFAYLKNFVQKLSERTEERLGREQADLPWSSFFGEAALNAEEIDDSVVNSNGFDLAAAIASCPAGGTVSVPAGVYRLTAAVERNSGITIEGAGAASTIVIFDWKDDCLLLANGEFALKNMSILADVDGEDLPGADLVLVESGHLLVDHCFLAGARAVLDEEEPEAECFSGGGGIRAGDEAEVEVCDSLIAFSYVGLIAHMGNVSAVRCEVYNCDFIGLFALDGDLNADGGTICRCGFGGKVFGDGAIVLRDVRAFQMYEEGFFAEMGEMALSGCIVERAQGDGVACDRDGQLRALALTVRDCATGASIEGEAEIRDSQFVHNKGDGLAVQSTGQVKLEAVKATDNQLFGLSSEPGAVFNLDGLIAENNRLGATCAYGTLAQSLKDSLQIALPKEFSDLARYQESCGGVLPLCCLDASGKLETLNGQNLYPFAKSGETWIYLVDLGKDAPAICTKSEVLAENPRDFLALIAAGMNPASPHSAVPHDPPREIDLLSVWIVGHFDLDPAPSIAKALAQAQKSASELQTLLRSA